jgi:hypothetical protein
MRHGVGLGYLKITLASECICSGVPWQHEIHGVFTHSCKEEVLVPL